MSAAIEEDGGTFLRTVVKSGTEDAAAAGGGVLRTAFPFVCVAVTSVAALMIGVTCEKKVVILASVRSCAAATVASVAAA